MIVSLRLQGHRHSLSLALLFLRLRRLLIPLGKLLGHPERSSSSSSSSGPRPGAQILGECK